MEWVFLVLGLVVGGVVGAGLVLLRQRRLEAAQAAAAAVTEERLRQAERQIEDERAFLARAKDDLTTAFRAAATTALQGNTDQFLALAKEKLEGANRDAASELEKRKTAIENLLSPVAKSLSTLEQQTRALEEKREGAYQRIDERVKELAAATTGLQSQTTSLATALKSSQVRGHWGEVQLRNVAVLAGMLEHCDFVSQQTTEVGGRPDMTVRLGGAECIAVDAKAPLSAYLTAVGAKTEPERDAALLAHAQALRGHVRSLAKREYAAAVGETIGLVVLFLPGESFLADAFARDPELLQDAWKQGVLIATPTTLLALLRTVAIYHQKAAIARNASEIAATARDLYERLAVFAGHFGGVGEHLRKAVDSYDKALRSYVTRIRPMGARLEDLQVPLQADARLDAPESVDRHPAALPAAEATPT